MSWQEERQAREAAAADQAEDAELAAMLGIDAADVGRFLASGGWLPPDADDREIRRLIGDPAPAARAQAAAEEEPEPAAAEGPPAEGSDDWFSDVRTRMLNFQAEAEAAQRRPAGA
jgi:hypothetical protein